MITTPLTFCATVNAILHVGATPVLADVDENGNLSPRSVAERITPRTRALLPVHLGGMPCRMDALWELARSHNLAVVEDAAHAVGTHYRGEHLGSAASSLSDAVAYSFYATKNITTGEGGMVTTNRKELAERMRILALHGISKDAWNRYSESGHWYYEVLEPGFKYNLSDLQAALGIHQLRKLDHFIERRAALAALYTHLLGGVEELETAAGLRLRPACLAPIYSLSQIRPAEHRPRRVSRRTAAPQDRRERSLHTHPEASVLRSLGGGGAQPVPARAGALRPHAFPALVPRVDGRRGAPRGRRRAGNCGRGAQAADLQGRLGDGLVP